MQLSSVSNAPSAKQEESLQWTGGRRSFSIGGRDSRTPAMQSSVVHPSPAMEAEGASQLCTPSVTGSNLVAPEVISQVHQASQQQEDYQFVRTFFPL